MNKKIPSYSIDKFTQDPSQDSFQIAVFNKDRPVKVEYPHRHDNFYEILLITEGSGVNKIDFTEYEIKPGSVFFVSPGQVHDIAYSDDIQGMIFLFNSEFYLLNKPDKNKLFDYPFFYSIHTHQSAIYLDEVQRQQLSALFMQARQESIMKQPAYREVVLSFLDIILNHCKRSFPSAEFAKPSKGIILVKKFKQLIEENYLKNYAVRDYADLLKITPNHLNETAKLLTGKNAGALIDEKLILEVKRMLIYTSLNITQISNEFNFADQSYFSKYVKKHTGYTPEAIRKMGT
ncbi:MAG TPA: AraC family transcriptional regulator [Cytophagales bacterium]|nr:AraC family transcriptional regulator [Cytophagales bacterium]